MCIRDSRNWRWLAKIFAFFGAGVGLFGIGTFTQVNSISSAVKNFFDPESSNVVFSAFGHAYTMATVVTGLILTPVSYTQLVQMAF